MRRSVFCTVTLVLTLCLSACSGPEKRVLVPFEDVIADVSFSLPAGTIGRGCGDGEVVGAVCFDPPVHPIGEVRSLSIAGREVELSGGKLVEGLLRTKDFGDLEFLISRAGRIDVLATERQIRQIASWLARTPARRVEPKAEKPVEEQTVAECVWPVAGDRDTAGASPPLRFDGLYQAPSGELISFLRFYPDARVVTASVGGPATVAQVEKWLDYEHGGSGRGNYRIDGHEITFETSSGTMRFQYRGTIETGALRLRMCNGVGYQEDSVYVFAPYGTR